jgi:2-keto-3-deoxy-L-rhamnonate aldolase RhmA
MNPEYMRQCEHDLLVMVQVESPKGVQAISEIAAIEGIDAIFLGPMDLSCISSEQLKRPLKIVAAYWQDFDHREGTSRTCLMPATVSFVAR